MNCSSEIKKAKYQELEAFIENLTSPKGELITVLHKAQELFGYLPEEVEEFIAAKLKIPQAEVYGVISFYSFFTTKPRGEYPISICMGTACYVRGAEDVLASLEKELQIKSGEVTSDGKFSIDILRCVGACVSAPVVIIGEDIYGKEEARDIKKLLEKY